MSIALQLEERTILPPLDFRFWHISSVVAMHQFDDYRRQSGLVMDIVEPTPAAG
jgi:hypothetical protein